VPATNGSETPANGRVGTLPAIVDEFIKLLDALTRLVGAIVLPVAVFAVFWIFRAEINALLKRTNTVSIKGAGFEASIGAQQAQAAGAIAAAVASKPVEGQDAKAMAQTAQAAASVVAASVTPQAVQKAQAATVLWVDDNPDNNIYVRRSLEALGVRFVIATSTDDGLAQAQRQTFDAIISDMGRGIDRTAGYKLLEQLRNAGIQSPYIIYAASTDPKRRAEAKRHGALDATNRPDELFQLVLSAIGSRG
jgi:CheY-like chemotaxis protein